MPLALAILTGCAIGAPPGFSPGDTWTFPLVDPLADGKLYTPVYVEGKGPYLFAIDPDAPVTMVDNEVAARGGFRAYPAGRFVDEHDTSHPTFMAELTNLDIGNLHISLRQVLLSDNGVFGDHRRRVYGVLGRDVIADSLVFGFDRERGIAWLQTHEAFKPPAGAQTIDYFKGTTARSDLVIRRLVTADVDGARYDLHLDLGDVPSQLRPEHWTEAKLHPVAFHASLVDEFGTHREVTTDGIADRVTVGPVTRERIGFVPYDDRRWDFGQLEGTLGLDFFRPFSVVADWHDQRYYLTPRHESAMDTAGRLARWGTALPESCRDTGCATLTIVRDGDQLVAHVEKQAAAARVNLEAIFTATAPDGTQLPRLYVSLPGGTDHFDEPIEARFEHASISLQDISPFPFACAGCIVTDEPLPP